MKVTALVENTCVNQPLADSVCQLASMGNAPSMELQAEHGLSLYIQTETGLRILFDMGQGMLFARNAAILGCPIADVDVAVISHGHYDHGGGLGEFLLLNGHAPVYLHRDAFQPHYSLRDDGLHYIGLDESLKDNPRIRLCSDPISIDPTAPVPCCNAIPDSNDNGSFRKFHNPQDFSAVLFSGVSASVLPPAGNKRLFGPAEYVCDDFCHEQSLIVREGDRTILFAGCAHTGIVNIMLKAQEITGKTPTHVFAGMHLMKSGLSSVEEDQYIQTLAETLLGFDGTQYYTMHCTGLEQYEKLKTKMKDRIEYFSCGQSVRN